MVLEQKIMQLTVRSPSRFFGEVALIGDTCAQGQKRVQRKTTVYVKEGMMVWYGTQASTPARYGWYHLPGTPLPPNQYREETARY